MAHQLVSYLKTYSAPEWAIIIAALLVVAYGMAVWRAMRRASR
jgi:hypothetical protein